MIDVETQNAHSKLVLSENEIKLPVDILNYIVTDEEVVAAIRGWAEEMDSVFESDDFEEAESDFELPQPDRNIVCINPDASLRWIGPEAPDESSHELNYYYSVYETGGDIWARNKNGYSYRLDPETGEILETVPASLLRLGDKEIEFEGGDVDKLIKHDEIIIVKLDTSQHEDPTSRNLFAYTPDGEQLWQIGENMEGASFPALNNAWEEDGKLYAYSATGYTYQIDWETGEPLDAEFTR